MKDSDSANKVVRLWVDKSHEARKLEDAFRFCGYEVQSIFSGSTEPVADSRGSFVTGYGEIRTVFSLPSDVSSQTPRTG